MANFATVRAPPPSASFDNISAKNQATKPAATATTATPITAPPSPLPSLHHLSRRCAVIAIAAPSPSLPLLRPIAAPPLLRCHHNCCVATTSVVIARPQQAHRSPERPSTMPLPPELTSIIPTQQSKVMNRKTRVVVERERGEDNVGDDDFDNDDSARRRRWRRRR